MTIGTVFQRICFSRVDNKEILFVFDLCVFFYTKQANFPKKYFTYFILIKKYFIISYILFLIRQTYIERDPGEKINDRNDRVIRVSVKWYNSHLNSNECNIAIVLLTDDAENKRHAIDDGIFVLSSKICHMHKSLN